MSVGLILTGVLNVLFGISSTLWVMAVIWGLNGLFQGWGWPPVAKLLTHWYSQKERGTWWGSWNSSHNVGGAVAFYIVVAVAQLLGWRYGMYVPGIICIGVGIFTFFCRSPMLNVVCRLMLLANMATRAATLSKPAGKITRKVSVLTWRHLVEGGLPPNSCEYEM